MHPTTALESAEVDGWVVYVGYDDDPLNPRVEYDNVGKIVHWHRRWRDFGDYFVNPDEYDSRDAFDQMVDEVFEPAVIVPIWMYDHSGVTIRAGASNPFSCPWDSGQVGFIFCTQEDVDREWSGDMDMAEKYLRGEVEVYDRYLRGDFYAYMMIDPDGEPVEYVGGFHDDEDALTEGLASARFEAERAKRKGTVTTDYVMPV